MNENMNNNQNLNTQNIINNENTNNFMYQNSNVPQEPQKKGNTLIIIIIIVILAIGLVGFVFVRYINKSNNSKLSDIDNEIETSNYENSVEEENNGTNNYEKTAEENNGTKSEVKSQSISEAVVNGVVITFPCTKEAFANTGWTWDEKYATKSLDSGYTTTGGRIGTYPGGVVVSVINISDEIQKIEDCTIDDGTFYNPEDNSDNVTFIGGLNFNSTEQEVQETMKSSGYNNPKINTGENYNYYKYFLNDDQNDYKNYIEFYYYKSVLKSVTIATAG